MQVEIEYGGEAMAQIVAHLCLSSSNYNETDVRTRIYGVVPALFDLLGGALFLSLSASAREGGCDLIPKVHGAYVPVECNKNTQVAHVRIGGSASRKGIRTGRPARPALEVAFHGTILDAGAVLSACPCGDVRDVLINAALVLLTLYDNSLREARLDFSRSLFITDGMMGRRPIGDGSEDPVEYVFKHVGACFREALFNGTEAEALDAVSVELWNEVSEEKLLVEWELQDLDWAATGVISAFGQAFQLLVDYSEEAVSAASVSPDKPLCKLEAPSEEVLAAEAEDMTSAKNIYMIYR